MNVKIDLILFLRIISRLKSTLINLGETGFCWCGIDSTAVNSTKTVNLKVNMFLLSLWRLAKKKMNIMGFTRNGIGKFEVKTCILSFL